MIYLNHELHQHMQAPKELKEVFTVGEILGLDCCCSVCQGILQIIDQDYFVDSMRQKIQKAGFEFESFKFNVHAPVSSSFR